MKKGLLFVALVAITLGFTSCGRQNALKLNNKLAGMSIEVAKKFELWGKQLAIANESRNYSDLKIAREDLEVFLNKNVEDLKKTKDVAGSERFRKSMIDLLEFHKTLCPLMSEFEKFDKSTPEEKIDELMEKYAEEADKETKYFTEMNSAQREFARKNNFKLVN